MDRRGTLNFPGPWPRLRTGGATSRVFAALGTFLPRRELRTAHLAMDSVHRRWSAEDLAEEVGLTRPHLSERFKEARASVPRTLSPLGQALLCRALAGGTGSVGRKCGKAVGLFFGSGLPKGSETLYRCHSDQGQGRRWPPIWSSGSSSGGNAFQLPGRLFGVKTFPDSGTLGTILSHGVRRVSPMLQRVMLTWENRRERCSAFRYSRFGRGVGGHGGAGVLGNYRGHSGSRT